MLGLVAQGIGFVVFGTVAFSVVMSLLFLVTRGKDSMYDQIGQGGISKESDYAGTGGGPSADRDHAAILAAADPLDADHFGAEIAEQRRAERSRDVPSEIENANAVEHTGHQMPPALAGVTPSLSPSGLRRMIRLQR